MTSTFDSPVPLKGKLTRLKCLLEDANRQLEEEATKYKILTTKTGPTIANSTNKTQNSNEHNQTLDLMKTMADISTLKSVISCPIFDRIVNVTDSLDKIWHLVNLHPSVVPSDINLDTDGQLLLAPPIEQTSLNNLINSKLDQYSDHTVAAQRTNKVIETKQGARNTVEIKSPACQTATNYVNKLGQGEFFSSNSPVEAANHGVPKKSLTARLQSEASAYDRSSSFESNKILKPEIEWEKNSQIIELYRDANQGFGFSINEYTDPKDPGRTIIMITGITPGGVACQDSRLGIGDLLIFVDDINLDRCRLEDAAKALKRANRHVRLGVLKPIRNDWMTPQSTNSN